METMDFRKLIDKVDTFSSEAKKEPERLSIDNALEHVKDIQWTEPTESGNEYSIANNVAFKDKDLTDNAVRLELFKSEMKQSPARLLGEIAQRIKPTTDAQIEIAMMIGKIGSKMANNEPTSKTEQTLAIESIKSAIRGMKIERSADKTPYKDDSEDDFKDESQSFKSDISKAIEEQDNLSEEFKILWDREPIKRGKGMYQAIQFHNGTISYVPMAVDGRPIWTGKVQYGFQMKQLLDLGFGLPAYNYGKDFDPDFQGQPDGYRDDGAGEYKGTHKKVGSRWVALDQYKHWKDSDDGNFYTDRNDSLSDLSFAEWKQAGQIRNINHELKMLALEIEAIPLRDKKEAYEAILTVNRAYRGDAEAFNKMVDMIEAGTDIQIIIAGNALRGKRELQDLINSDEIQRALTSKSHAEKMAEIIKDEATETAKDIKGDAGSYSTNDMGQTSFKGNKDMAKNAQASQSGGNTSGRNNARTNALNSLSKDDLPDVTLDSINNDSEQLDEKVHQRRIQSNGNTVNFNIDKSKPVTKAKYQGKSFEIYADPEEIEKWLGTRYSNGWTIDDIEKQDGTTSKVTGNPVKVGTQTAKVGTQGGAGKINPEKWDQISALIKQAVDARGKVNKTEKDAEPEQGADKGKKLDPNSDEAKQLFKDLELESIQSVSEGGVKRAMEDDAESMSKEEFIAKHGEENADFYDNYNGTDESVEEDWFNGLDDVTLNGDEFYENFGWIGDNEENIDEAEYQGRKVKLNKPMRGDVKKFKVYVKNPKGNVVKVNFGDPDMKIKRSNPKRRKSFRARHNCDSPGPKHKARYWSCRKW